MCAKKKTHKLYHYLKQYVCMYLCFITVYAEKCTTNGDCGSVMCGSGFHVICEHSQEVGVSTNGGICTCAQDNYRTCFLIDERVHTYCRVRCRMSVLICFIRHTTDRDLNTFIDDHATNDLKWYDTLCHLKWVRCVKRQIILFT